MDPTYEAALRVELDSLQLSPDRPAKYRRIAEVCAQLGEAPPAFADADAATAMETAVANVKRTPAARAKKG